MTGLSLDELYRVTAGTVVGEGGRYVRDLPLANELMAWAERIHPPAPGPIPGDL